MIGVPYEIQDIKHHRPVSCSHFIYYEIVVRIQCQLVVRHQVPRNRLPVVRSKEFCRCVPQLTRFVRLCLIQPVLKLCVSFPQQSMEGRAIAYVVEVKRFARAEDGRVFGEIAIVGVI